MTMTDADYEYELMRSELLGLTPPDRQALSCKSSAAEDDSDDCNVAEQTIQTDQEVEVENEQLKHTSGGLDELNSILNVTQKKLNKFKVVCGSFTNLLKIRMTGGGKDNPSCSNSSSHAYTESDTEGQRGRNSTQTNTAETASSTTKPVGRIKPHDVDMNVQISSQIDKLDSMLMKADRAEMSLSNQNKQMRAFLNK